MALSALNRLLDRALGGRIRREVAAEGRGALAGRLPEIEARAADAAYELVRANALTEPLVWGPPERVHVADSAIVNDALLNTESGSITVDADAFFGHRVCVLTGTHDVA